MVYSRGIVCIGCIHTENVSSQAGLSWFNLDHLQRWFEADLSRLGCTVNMHNVYMYSMYARYAHSACTWCIFKVVGSIQFNHRYYTLHWDWKCVTCAHSTCTFCVSQSLLHRGVLNTACRPEKKDGESRSTCLL